MKLTLVTKDGRRLLKSVSRESGNPKDMETYGDATGKIEIICSTKEREGFEAAYAVKLAADVLDVDSLFALTSYLTVNAELIVQGGIGDAS